ncbi:MAG: sugar ABC transporter ATP-binding protein [Planctomycetes bacterium]|nr:sugar ABC transporter ATP-binding protein [Planctomycetota bacterium]
MPPLLTVTGVSKAFPGVQALAKVNLELAPGEILAVVGENGAGKSTLMKILAGVHQPDAGTIALDGRPVSIRGVKEAEHLGIVLIHQELNLAGHLDVAGNIYLGREPTWGGILGFIDRRRIHDDSARITRRLGLTTDTRALVRDLSIGQQQLVEIARALSLSSRVLILDEPTSSLTESETERLFAVLGELKDDGIGILYISHRLKEVEKIADRVVVLRDGRNAGELPRADICHQAIVNLMVGRELKQFFHRQRHEASSGEPGRATGQVDAPRVQVQGLRWSARQPGISFAIRAGEIVGMAGLMGSGRTELAETLFGVRRSIAGTIAIDGKPIRLGRPADAIRAGIFLIPEDRRIDGLILDDNVKHNISIAVLQDVSRFGFVHFRQEARLAQVMCDRFRVRTPGTTQIVGNLSGGNQQKVVLAKWLSRTPRLLILDEPTRGIDVGAKSEIYALMDELARQGAAVLMISSDLEEILGMSDRVLVMHQGAVAGELERAALSEEAIMHLATGGVRT